MSYLGVFSKAKIFNQLGWQTFIGHLLSSRLLARIYEVFTTKVDDCYWLPASVGQQCDIDSKTMRLHQQKANICN